MDIDSIPEAFQSKIRLAILAALITGDRSFNEIKKVTKATDGNLGIHLGKLEEMKYLSVTKDFVAKKPRTTYSLTDTGKAEFKEYVRLLESLVRGTE